MGAVVWAPSPDPLWGLSPVTAAPPSGWLTAANMCFMAAVSLHVATAAKNANLNGNSGNQGVLVGGSKPAGGLRFNANIGNFRFQVEKVVKIT